MNTSIDEANRLVDAAHQAFLASHDISLKTRAGWLESVATALDDRSDELVSLAGDETHLTHSRLTGELLRTTFQLRLLADEIAHGRHLAATIDHADASWGMGPRPDLRRINEPLGVVGVFGASNFPFAFSVMGGDSASALAAGCSVVHKAHPAHPRLARRTAEVAVEALSVAGAPHGLFSLVEGRDAANALVDHRLVKAVGFTGSTAGGRALFDRIAARPEPVPFYGELGSTNPAFVTERAWNVRSEQIIAEFIASVSLGMGQFCTKPGFLFIPSSGGERAKELLATIGERFDGHPMLSDGLRDSFDRSLAELTGNADFSADSWNETNSGVPGLTILRTTTDTILRDPQILEHEMFGPASVIVEYEGADELVRIARLMQGQLTSTVQAEHDEDLHELVDALSARSGRVLWNGWPTGVSVTYAQHHGGPYPATTAAATTSVGTAAIERFLRPVAYQGFPPAQLPLGLRDDNPLGIPQRVDGTWLPGGEW